MDFLELWQEPGVYSQVMAGMIHQISCLISDVTTPVSLLGTPQQSPRGLAGKYGHFFRLGGRHRVPFKLQQ